MSSNKTMEENSSEKTVTEKPASDGSNTESEAANSSESTESKIAKSKVRMNKEKAAAIARLRSTDIPEDCGLQYDVGPDSESEVQVVFKERTAL